MAASRQLTGFEESGRPAADGAGGSVRPFRQSAAESARSGRDLATGRVVAGNQLARKYPKVADPAEPEMAERLSTRATEIVEDLGGPDRVGHVKRMAVERFVLLEAFAKSWESYFVRSGLVTRQGRVRSGYAAGYLATVAQLMRLAQLIGLDRVTKAMPITPRDWLESARTDGATESLAHEPHSAEEDSHADHQR